MVSGVVATCAWDFLQLVRETLSQSQICRTASLYLSVFACREYFSVELRTDSPVDMLGAQGHGRRGPERLSPCLAP